MTMASAEHKNLADFIKNVHSNLRRESQIHGEQEAWKRHVAQHEILQKYAASMQELATKYWAENVADPMKSTKCRVDWVVNQCSEYFLKGGIQLYNEREIDIKQRMMSTEVLIPTKNAITNTEVVKSTQTDNTESVTKFAEESHCAEENTGSCKRFKQSGKDDAKEILDSIQLPKPQHSSRIKLLDVGSCYNPFGNVHFFDVTAIDLAPSCDEVLQCDFLSLQVGSENVFSEDAKSVFQLTTNSFDTVVFCLLLEYLPSPEQRYTCCEKAYNLLKNDGILLIVTPDSKHVGANAKIMKSWRYALSRLGFMRIKYEKLPHAHCLVFRKCFFKDVARRWADLQKVSKDDELFKWERKMFIPQDFRETAAVQKECKQAECLDRTIVANVFSELPYT